MGYGFIIRENDKAVAISASDSVSSYSTNHISVLAELQLKDTLNVYTCAHLIRGTYPSLAIMKVKKIIVNCYGEKQFKRRSISFSLKKGMFYINK